MSSILKGGALCYDDLLTLQVSKDGLEATLRPVTAIDPATLDLEKLMGEVTGLGVVFGLLPAPEPKEDGSYAIARGRPAVDGENARVKVHVKPTIAKKLPGKDRVDYRELGNIVNVVKEQLLLEVSPPTEGTLGKDVLGGSIAAKSGRDLKLKAGPGVKISEDGRRVYSILDGKFVMLDSKPSVFGEHHVQGDVDMSVGNVVFTGDSLNIQGDVLPGFKVKCRGHIVVQRGINNAEVLAGGRLTVRGSVVGEQARARSKGDMSLGFVENGPVIETLGSLTVADFILQAKVRVTHDLLAVQGNGTMVGGQYIVGGSVFVKDLGSDGEVATELNVGINPGLELKKEKLEAEMKIWPEKLNEVLKNIGSLQQMKKKEGNLPPPKEEMLKKLSAIMPQLMEKVNTLTELGKEIEAEKEKLVKECVYVYGRVYPGVTVKIGSAIRCTQEEEESVVIHFETGSRQIRIRKMTREERQEMGRRPEKTSKEISAS